VRALTSIVLTAAVFVSLLVVAVPQASCEPDKARLKADVTYLGGTPGHQLYRYDYTLANAGLGGKAKKLKVFFNEDGEKRANLVSVVGPAGWTSTTSDETADPDAWIISWESPDEALGVDEGDSLAGFSVTIEWNEPSTVPGVQSFEPSTEPIPERDVELTADVTYLYGEPENQVYRYDYTLINRLIRPSVQRLIVFFDRDGVDRSDYISSEGPDGWTPLPVGSTLTSPSWTMEWNDAVGDRGVLCDQTLPGFSVTFLWKDPSEIPGRQVFRAYNGYVRQYRSTIGLISNIEGSVLATVNQTCDGVTSGATGITVDLFDSEDTMIRTDGTDEQGNCLFEGLMPGLYTATIVTPIGHVALTESQATTVLVGYEAPVGFDLECLAIAQAPRGMGYWKHQVNVHLEGRGRAHESLEEMLEYLQLIVAHFNENVYNPVMVYEAGASITEADSLQALRSLLAINKGGTHLDKAKQQLVALLLNVVSGKISQTERISADLPEGRTVSQAITHCNSLIINGDTGDDELAKDIAEMVNKGVPVPAGAIPSTTADILYSLRRNEGRDPEIKSLSFPNPFATRTVIHFSVPSLESNSRLPRDVTLGIYGVTGRLVSTLIDGTLTPGSYSARWDGVDSAGREVPSGVYFYRLAIGENAHTSKIVLWRR